MKRAICIVLTIAVLFTLTSGCGKSKAGNQISEVKVTLPFSIGSKAVVEGEAVIATQLYLLSRAYLEKLENYDMALFNAQEYRELLAETLETLRVAEAFCGSFENHAASLAAMEENNTIQHETAKYELLSMSADGIRHSPFAAVAYAAEEKSPAVRYAEELTKTFDNAKNGQKLKAVAEKYGTDVKKAKVMLDQAQAILEGAAYEDQAAFENKCYQAAVETKAAASAIGFGVGCAAVMASGGLAVASFIEGGGLIMNGISAVVDMGTAVTVHATHGEGNEYTAAWERTAEIIAPVSAVFAIGGGIQNIKDFRNPEKASEMVNNAAQAFFTGLGFARDYVQEGTVLGVSSNIIDGYRQIIVRSADKSDPNAAKEVLLKTGVSEADLQETGKSDSNVSAASDENQLGSAADFYIEAMREIANPYDPVDMDSFLKYLDNAFRECASDEGAAVYLTDPADDPAPESAFEQVSEPVFEQTADFVAPAEAYDSEANIAVNMTPESGYSLMAANVAGSYYFPELEDSARISFAAVDDAHISITDVANGESFVGEYDASTGILSAVLSDRFQWYVTVVFTDTGYGIQAVLDETLGGMSVTSSAMKE